MNKLKKFLFLGLLTVNNISSTDVIKSITLDEYNNSINNNTIDTVNLSIKTIDINNANDISEIKIKGKVKETVK